MKTLPRKYENKSRKFNDAGFLSVPSRPRKGEEGMNIRIILLILAALTSAIFISAASTEPIEMGGKTFSSIDKGSGIENINYIAVDKNRVINEIGKTQSMKSMDKVNNYNRDLESWLEPQTQKRISGQRKDDLEFARGMGVDADIQKSNDAFSNGAFDARQIQHIREDTRS